MSNPKFAVIAEHFVTVIKHSAPFKGNKAIICNDTDLLLPEFKTAIDNVINDMLNEHGIKIIRKETFRTNAMQLYYYNNGLSKIKLNGMHHYGIAQDMLCLNDKGSVIDKGGDPAYKKLWAIAAKYGLTNLGEWDAGHLQYIPVSEQAALRLFVSNYRAKKYVILEYGIEHPNVKNLKFALDQLGFYKETPAEAVETESENVPDPYPTDPEAKKATGLQSDFYGHDTENAVTEFQAFYKLSKDGVTGEQVYTKLDELGYNIAA